MADTLEQRRIAFLAADGVEQIELTEPWEAVRGAGANAVLISIEPDEVQAFEQLQPAERFGVDLDVGDADASDFDGLVLPGGVANPDFLRMDERAVDFARDFVEQAKPVGAICHAPWLLVEAAVVSGRTLTSFPSLATDIRNAGGHWVDEEVVVHHGLVTSRRPSDLAAFCATLVEQLGSGMHPPALAVHA